MAEPRPPPRYTGETQQDTLAIIQWLNDFYTDVVRDTQYTTQGDVEGFVDPAVATAGSAQSTANEALEKVNDIIIGYARVVDEKTANTAGGDSVAGTQTRDLNKIAQDINELVSIGSDQFTLNEGIYILRASAPAYAVGAHRIRLYDVTASAVLTDGYGTSEFVDAANLVVSRSFVSARVEITAPNVYRIEHYTAAVVTDGLGKPVNDSAAEIYTVLEILQLRNDFVA